MCRLNAAFILPLFMVVPGFSQTGQNSLVRDSQAVAYVQQAISTMAATVPSDSTETGNVEIIAGSSTNQGTIQVLTLGMAQTSAQVQSSAGNWTVVYSQGQASRTDEGVSTALHMESASTSQCLLFPLPYLVAILQSQDYAIQYVGSESLNGIPVQHVRAWNTFASSPSWQFLSPFTLTDIWFDASSGLPKRISFIHRDGGGAAPKILNVIDYSDFQSSGGVLYPAQIQQSMSGTLWMTISIQSASFNTGLTNSDFSLVQGGN